MIKHRGQPGICAVAVIAGIYALYVIRRLARGNHTVMTRAATSLHLGMIHSQGRHPKRCSMTSFTGIRTLDMGDIFARGGHAVVTTHAIACDIQMIEVGWQPRAGGMTVITSFLAGYVVCILARCGHAIVAGGATPQHFKVINLARRNPQGCGVASLADITALDMRDILTRSLDPIVTTLAIAHDTHVIKVRGQPGVARVAVAAGVLAGNVVGGLARGGHSIVTVGTGSHHLKVIYPDYRDPQSRAMAGLTDAGRLDMELVLAGSFHAIVASLAITKDTHVIEGRRQPGAGRMASITGVVTGNVVHRLALGNHAIVTGGTVALHFEMIHLDYRCPERGAMTGFANI